MKKNLLTLQPKDFIQLHCGLKIENVGNMVIELELPNFAKVYHVNEPEIISVSPKDGGKKI